jgi:hypothetical protein
MFNFSSILINQTDKLCSSIRMDEVSKLAEALERVLTFKGREERWLEEIPGKCPW